MSHPDRSISLRGLAIALFNRFDRTGSMTSFVEAISILFSLIPGSRPIQILKSLRSRWKLGLKKAGTKVT